MFRFTYYANAGIVDFFEMYYSKYELIEKLFRDYSEITSDSKEKWLQELNVFEEEANIIIEALEKEKPFLIKYFGIPDFCDGHFKVCCLARISNNGATYLFAEDKELIMFLSSGNVNESEIAEM